MDRPFKDYNILNRGKGIAGQDLRYILHRKRQTRERKEENIFGGRLRSLSRGSFVVDFLTRLH